jgi:hypothetical protein
MPNNPQASLGLSGGESAVADASGPAGGLEIKEDFCPEHPLPIQSMPFRFFFKICSRQIS